MRTWAFLAIVILSTASTRADYGDKVKSNNTSPPTNQVNENFASSEEYYDDSPEEQPTDVPEKPLTTPDDGVIIEKAILAAEITPKASYSLIENPIRYDDSLGDRYTQAKFGDKNEFFGFSSSDSSQEEVNTSVPSYSTSQNSIENEVPKKSKGKASYESMQKSSQTYNGYQFPSWNFLDMYNFQSQFPQKSFSSSYRFPAETSIEQNKVGDINANGAGLSEDGSYDPLANGDFLHLGYQSSPRHSTPPTSTTFSPELTAQLEQERQYQIQSTMSYLKQIEAAQEYASKVQALQDAYISNFQSVQDNIPWWPNSGVEEVPSTTTMKPTTKPKVVPKTDAPGVKNFAQKETYTSNHLFSAISPISHSSAAHVNSLTGLGWMVPFVPTPSPSRFVPYTGPTASPVVLPSGFLADTEEVTQARIAHLQALMNAIQSTSAWREHQPHPWS